MNGIMGIVPVFAPPFTVDGELDYYSIDSLIEYIIDAGADALTLFGIGGEYYKLTEEERKLLVEYVINRISGRIKCIISVTDHSYESAIKFARFSENKGADMLMLLPPFFLGPSQEMIIKHIQKVCNAVKIPIMLQYAPNETGVNLSINLFAELEKNIPNFNYIKVECKPPGPMISSILMNTGLEVFIGYAGLQLIDGLERGIKGVVPGCSLTEIYVKIFNNYISGNKDKAYKIYLDLVVTLNFIFQSIEMIIKCEKIILHRRGIIKSSYCRAESYKLDNQFKSQLNYYMKRVRAFCDVRKSKPHKH